MDISYDQGLEIRVIIYGQDTTVHKLQTVNSSRQNLGV